MKQARDKSLKEFTIKDDEGGSPDCVSIPHKPGECWWCDSINTVQDIILQNLNKKQGE
jgi:hypothetical protein